MARIMMLNVFGMERINAELIHFSSIANGFSTLDQEVIVTHVSVMNHPANHSLLLPSIRFNEFFLRGKSYLLFITCLLSLPAFLKELRAFAPDILYVRLGVFSALYVLVARIFLGNRIQIVTEHNGWIGPEAQLKGMNALYVRLGVFFQTYSSLYSDNIRAVSEGIMNYLVSLGVPKGRIFVSGNGTDLQIFQPKSVRCTWDIGFIGNLAKWQGLDILLESLATLKNRKDSIRVVIVGVGAEEKNLRMRMSQLGLEKMVDMLGPIPYHDIPEIINRCRVCVAPFLPRGSTADNNALSPLKIRDYAACGKPIIASRIAGLEEIEQANFGILVTPGDVKHLSDSIIYLLENPSLAVKMGQNAREYAEKHYSWQNICMEILNHLNINNTLRNINLTN